MFKRIKEALAKSVYKLRAKCGDQVEELAVFDRKVGLAEVMPYLDSMDDCQAVFLDVYKVVDGEERYVRRQWYKKLQKRQGNPMSRLDELIELKEKIDKLAGGKDPGEYFASATMLIKALKELTKELNASEKGGGIDDLIKTIIEAGLKAYITRQAAQQAAPPPAPVQLPPPPPDAVEEARKRVEEIIDKAYADTTKAIAPCTAEKCEEVGGNDTGHT